MPFFFLVSILHQMNLSVHSLCPFSNFKIQEAFWLGELPYPLVCLDFGDIRAWTSCGETVSKLIMTPVAFLLLLVDFILLAKVLNDGLKALGSSVCSILYLLAISDEPFNTRNLGPLINVCQWERMLPDLLHRWFR